MSLNTSDSFGPQPQRGEQLDDSFLVRVNSQEDEHDRLPVADDEKQSARNDGFCDSLRRFCPCEHMQHQLGLLAVDAQDSMRVYLRFVSLVHLACSMAYFFLLLAFVGWFDYSGGVALLSLTFVASFLLACLGVFASRRHRRSESASASSGVVSLTPISSLTAAHPRLLFVLKWASLSPLPLLALLFALFLACVMAGWLDVTSTLTSPSTQQVTSVILLSGVSLGALALQCGTFLLTSSWRRAERGARDDDRTLELELELEWNQHDHEQLHTVANNNTSATRIDDL